MFLRILFSPNSAKRHICDIKNSLVGHNLAISINNGVVSPFHKDFIFMKLCINAKFRENTLQIYSSWLHTLFGSYLNCLFNSLHLPAVDPNLWLCHFQVIFTVIQACQWDHSAFSDTP